MKNINYILAIVILLGTISLGSCKKKRANKSTISSQDNAAAEAAFNDVFKISEDALKDNNLEKSLNSGLSVNGANCATVTVTPAYPDTTFPKTVTIDFGSVNCVDNYGVNRRGLITIVVTGKYRTVGTSLTMTTLDYYVNDIKVEGNLKVVNLGPNSAGHTAFSVGITNAKVTYTNGDFTTYESARIREWVVGENTQGLLGVFDDEYDITGTANGIDRNGLAYTMTITSPLRVAVLCRWIKQGKLEIQPDGLALRTVDFGNGDCDAVATVEINGNVYTFNAQ